MKKCFKCGVTKQLNQLPKHRHGKDGYYSQCKPCTNSSNRKYYTNNKEKRKQQFKAYYRANQQKLVSKNSKQTSFRRKTNLECRIAANLRRRLNHIVRGKNKNGSAVKDLGCSVAELKIYIEKQFQLGMSWENYGEWHLDHIKPLSKFNLKLRKSLLIACHYSNLQPLWKSDNISKGNRVKEVKDGD